MKYEYYILELSDDPNKWQDELKPFGQSGWRLVQIKTQEYQPHVDDDGRGPVYNDTVAVMMRENSKM